MPRGPSFPISDFIDMLPSDREEAITAIELTKRMGCSRNLTNKRMAQLINEGSVERGLSTTGGVYTYYKLLPDTDLETGMPQVINTLGVRQPLVWYIDPLINNQSMKLADEQRNKSSRAFITLVASALDLDGAPEFKVAVVDARRDLAEVIGVYNKRIKMFQSLIDNTDLRNYPEGHDKVRESIVAFRNSIEADNETIIAAMRRMKFAVSLANDEQAREKEVKRIYGRLTDNPYPPVGVDEVSRPAE